MRKQWVVVYCTNDFFLATSETLAAAVRDACGSGGLVWLRPGQVQRVNVILQQNRGLQQQGVISHIGI